MIPLELTLRNFMSYGDEEVALDLSPLHTVCLSGENGHGKSALLDAITWSLWGETRLGKQNHDQLIRIGADEMAVSFSFIEGGSTYRVRRQRSKRAGSQVWELQQADGAGGWRPLTGASSSDTAKSVVQIVRMSYDTFLNSAYLKQGRADEFVRQTPNKRKEILAEILELSRYDQLEAKSRARMREAADRALDGERALNLIERELADEPAHQAALIDCQERALRLAGEREVATAKWEKLKELRATLQSQREQAKRLEDEFGELTKEIKYWQSERAVEQQAVDRHRALIKDRERIVDAYERLCKARALSEELGEKARRAQKLEKERVGVEAEIDRARYDLSRRLEQLDPQYREGRKLIDELPILWEKLEATKKHLAGFQELESEEVELRREKEVLADEFAQLRADKRQADEKLTQTNERFTRISEQREACSVCGSPLPPSKIAILQADCENEINEIEAEQRRLNQSGRANREKAQSIDARLAEIAKAMEGIQRLRDDLGRQSQLIQDREALATGLPELEGKLERLRKNLEAENYAQDSRRRLAAILKEAHGFVDIDQQYDETLKAVRSLANAEREFHALEHAEAELAHARKRLANADRQIEGRLAKQNQKLDERKALAGIEPKFAETEQVLKNLTDHRRELEDQARRVDEERGRLQHMLDRCAAQRKEKVRLEKERDQARKEEEAFTQLAGAFSKRGVQALIIEQALPELQNEANELLERLTDGDLSISIQTTRAAKSKSVGEAIETLDIHVSDSLGTRPLELYSGGESFRISFAIRIALSHLLARRAGASLQTLIIDEGFGTQDAKGREKLVDAINAIKDEFAKIIVVTHIDELKEAFPARIEVVKTPSGSEVSIVEGGIIG